MVEERRLKLDFLFSTVQDIRDRANRQISIDEMADSAESS